MKFINYKDDRRIRRDVSRLYVSAFPIEERPPVNIFFKFAKRENDELYAIYDDGFVGFTNLLIYKDLYYVFFLAVSETKRNKGYGSKILSGIKELMEDKTIVLCYEEIDDKYPDNEMRKRRREFYYRNGFIDNNLKVNEYGVIYDTCYIGKEKVKFEDYIKIYHSIFGEMVYDYVFEVK